VCMCRVITRDWVGVTNKYRCGKVGRAVIEMNLSRDGHDVDNKLVRSLYCGDQKRTNALVYQGSRCWCTSGCCCTGRYTCSKLFRTTGLPDYAELGVSFVRVFVSPSTRYST
jgi:hypothetical protein